MKKIALLLLTLAATPLAAEPRTNDACPAFVEIGPFSQQSASTPQVVELSAIDARCFSIIDYMACSNGGYVRVWLFGSNFADFDHEVILSSFDIYDGGGWDFSDAPAAFARYRLKMMTVPNQNPGVITIKAIAKR